MHALVDRHALAEGELPGDGIVPAKCAVANLSQRLRCHLGGYVAVEFQFEDERAFALLEGEPQVDPPADLVEGLFVAVEELVAPIAVP